MKTHSCNSLSSSSSLIFRAPRDSRISGDPSAWFSSSILKFYRLEVWFILYNLWFQKLQNKSPYSGMPLFCNLRTKKSYKLRAAYFLLMHSMFPLFCNDGLQTKWFGWFFSKKICIIHFDKLVKLSRMVVIWNSSGHVVALESTYKGKIHGASGGSRDRPNKVFHSSK